MCVNITKPLWHSNVPAQVVRRFLYNCRDECYQRHRIYYTYYLSPEEYLQFRSHLHCHSDYRKQQIVHTFSVYLL